MKRRTSSGREFPRKYNDSTSLERIIDLSDTPERDELHQNERVERVERVVNFIKITGYGTALEFFDDLLKFTPRNEKTAVKFWLQGENFTRFIEDCTVHRHFKASESFNNLIFQKSKHILRQEMRSLTQSESLRCPVTKIDISQVYSFSFEEHWTHLQSVAPKLTSLFISLSTPERQSRLPEDAKQQRTGEQHTDSEDDDVPPTSIGRLPEKEPITKKTRSRQLAAQMSLSALLYAHSQRSNALACQIGYFLQSFRTPKRIIASLHRFGICISYESITAAMKSVAQSSEDRLQDWASEFPPLFAYVDNMNFLSRVRDQLLHHRAEMQNYTVGYIGLNPAMREKEMLKREPFLDRIATLNAEHLLPKSGHLVLGRDSFLAGLSHVLHTYCKPHLLHPGAKPFEYPDIFRLPAQKTKVSTLRVYEKNEAIIGELTDVLRGVMEELGYTREQVADRSIFFNGDYLTVRNIRFNLTQYILLTMQGLPSGDKWNQYRKITLTISNRLRECSIFRWLS